MTDLPKTALYIGLCVMLSVWISGCWSTLDKVIDKNPFKQEAPKSNPGLFLFPNIPSLTPPASKFEKNFSYNSNQ